MSIVSERRRDLRSVVTWPATVFTSEAQVEGQIENIGPGGAFISFPESPPFEESFRMVIKVPDRQTMNVGARVIWSTVLSTDEGSPYFGVGVEFTRISDGDRQFFAGHLA
jgi:Tfp pilus assembly protein PilZ